MTHATVNVTEVLSEMLWFACKTRRCQSRMRARCSAPKEASTTEAPPCKSHWICTMKTIWYQNIRTDTNGSSETSFTQARVEHGCLFFPKLITVSYCITLYRFASCLTIFSRWASSVTQTTNAMKESIQAAGPGQRQITSKASSYRPASSNILNLPKRHRLET